MEAIGQLQQALSRKSIRTTDPVTEGKGLSIFADAVETEGQRKLMVRYKVTVQPVENANKSSIRLQFVEVQAQGARERTAYKDETRNSVPLVEQQILGQVQGICRPAQP